MTAFRCFLLSSLSALSIGRALGDPGLLAPVARNLEHARVCRDTDQFGEARAYAEMTLLTRPVSYCVAADQAGIVRRALDVWQASLGQGVSFVEASPETADLCFEFKPSVWFTGKMVAGAAATYRHVTRWRGDRYTYRVTGSIEIALNGPAGLPISDAALTNSTLHELGHFFGLDDSTDSRGVMSPIRINRPVTCPSEDEVSRLLAMRAEASEVFAQTEALFARH